MGWSFPIMDFYAAELEKCSEVENVTVNTNLLAPADAQEQVRLACPLAAIPPTTSSTAPMPRSANGPASAG